MIEVPVRGFLDFIRERGVMGLAVGFVMGSAVQKVVTSFVQDLLNPLVGLMAGSTEKLTSLMVGPFAVGDFLSTVLDFLILAFAVYFIFKILGLDKLDKKQE